MKMSRNHPSPTSGVLVAKYLMPTALGTFKPKSHMGLNKHTVMDIKIHS
jgi:hypothetical protein